MRSFLPFVLFIIVGLVGVNEQAWAMGKKTRSDATRADYWPSLSSQSSAESAVTFSSPVDMNFEDGVGFNQELASLNAEPKEESQVSNQMRTAGPENPVALTAVPSQENSELPPEKEAFPSTTTVPEPATLTLMGLGMAGLLLKRHKK